MRNIIKSIPKELIYQYYEILVFETIDYDRITRFKMVDEIIEVLKEQPDMIGDIYSEFQLNNLRNEMYKADELMYSDVNLLFVYTMDEHSELKLLPFVKQYLDDNFETLAFQQLQEFKKFFLGCMGVYGHVYFDDILRIYEEVRSSKFKALPVPDLIEHTEFVLALQTDDYLILEGSIVHPLALDCEKPFPVSYIGHVYTLDEYLYFGKNLCFNLPTEFTGVDIELSSSYRLRWQVRQNMLTVQNDDNPSFLVHHLQKVLEELSDMDNEDRISAQELLNLPIWLLGGQTGKDFLNTEHKGIINEKYLGLFEFFRDEYLLYGLKKYHKHNRSKSVIELRESLNMNDAADLLHSLVNDPKFTQRFIQSKSYTEHEFVDVFIKAIENPIIIEKGFSLGFTNHKLDIYHDNCVYRVSGLKQPIEQTVAETGRFLNTILFPLDDSITYGLGLQEFGISIGDNMAQVFKKEAKHANVIESFTDLIKAQEKSNVKLN